MKRTDLIAIIAAILTTGEEGDCSELPDEYIGKVVSTAEKMVDEAELGDN